MGTHTTKSHADIQRKYYKKVAKQKNKADNDRSYLTRRFVAVDGEGINVRTGKRKGAHDYVLLAISGAEPIMDKNGLRTWRILDYLWNTLDPKNLNVIYGGSYDFNCWLADFPEDVVKNIYEKGRSGHGFMYGGYTIKWMKGKSFSIKKGTRTVTIYDVISFFQKPFIGACDEYLGDYEGRDVLVREKARRGNFTWREISSIGRYNNLELDLLVRLCNELRIRLDKVGLRPRAWIGPGAIASALFTREGIREHMSRNIPAEVARASRFAYAGGRFEDLQYGVSKEQAWEYDVNSAYPKALSLVPSLSSGEWKHVQKPRALKPFALYRVRWDSPPDADPRLPGPLFVRGGNGTIAYPMRGENWVWTPEVENLEEYSKLTGLKYRLLEAWEWHPETNVKPFGFVPALYERRKALKAAGDGAHVGIKLCLNSMYGKGAQQVGWNRRTNEPPTWHQLEWAGFVTSWCRAQVLKAAMQDLDAVIAFETDALFTKRPLNLPVSDRLGEWEETVFESLTYVQSGHYYGTEIKPDGTRKEIQKTRGVDRGELTREKTESYFALPLEQRVQDAKLTRFVGAGVALNQGFTRWRTWETQTKQLHLWPMGKRIPLEDTDIGWRRTICPVAGGMSAEYPVEWINPNPEMKELAELRESEYYYE